MCHLETLLFDLNTQSSQIVIQKTTLNSLFGYLKKNHNFHPVIMTFVQND